MEEKEELEKAKISLEIERLNYEAKSRSLEEKLKYAQYYLAILSCFAIVGSAITFILGMIRGGVL